MLAAKKPKKGAASAKISIKGFGSAPVSSANKGSDEGVLLRDPVTQGLYTWLEAAGVDLRSIALADFAGLRGVMALRDIKKGQSSAMSPRYVTAFTSTAILREKSCTRTAYTGANIFNL
jgi:hypothetical protein